MDVLGTVIPIPESLADLRGNQRFTFLRHICAADLDCYGFLAFLMGVIDTGDIEQLSPQVRDGLMADQRCAALLEHCRVNGNGILQHHRLRFFKDMKETLRLAAVKMMEITKNQYENLGVSFEHEQSGLLLGAKFGIFTKENQIFTVYKLETVSSDTMLCCGCRYKTTIYQEYTESTFPDFCPHHDREVLRRMLWDLTPEPCEEVLEGYILSGQPLPACQKCKCRSYTAVLTDVCGNGCSFCLSCLDTSKDTYKQMCPNCGTALRWENVVNIPEPRASKLSDLQRSICSVFSPCQLCGAATAYPLLFLGSPHANCYWCAACHGRSPSNCQKCGELYIPEEAAALANMSQECCPACFLRHTCETTCSLCTSAKQYSEYFGRESCGLCGAPIAFVACQRCHLSFRPQNLQVFEGLQMCKNCFAECQPAAPAGLPPPAEEHKAEAMDLHQSEDSQIARVPEDEVTPGEVVKNGCRLCCIEVSDELFHECVRQEGRCCLWCFAKLTLQSPKQEYCSFCLTPACSILNSAVFMQLSLCCEECNEPSILSNLFHRSRCGKHIICAGCASRQLRKTNGLTACPCCVQPVEGGDQDRCKKCGNTSSPKVHAENTTCLLCWNCARTNQATAEKCECGDAFTDSLREALLMEQGKTCFLCKRYRPLYDYRCSCKIGLCAECNPQEKKCPQCKIEKSPPEDWIEMQKNKCVGCLKISTVFPLICGHYCHKKCYRRVGGCPYCSIRPADQPVNP